MLMQPIMRVMWNWRVDINGDPFYVHCSALSHTSPNPFPENDDKRRRVAKHDSVDLMNIKQIEWIENLAVTHINWSPAPSMESHKQKKKQKVKEKQQKEKWMKLKVHCYFTFYFFYTIIHCCAFMQVCVCVRECACGVQRVNNLVRRRMVQNLVKFHFQSLTIHFDLQTTTEKKIKKKFVILLNWHMAWNGGRCGI